MQSPQTNVRDQIDSAVQKAKEGAQEVKKDIQDTMKDAKDKITETMG